MLAAIMGAEVAKPQCDLAISGYEVYVNCHHNHPHGLHPNAQVSLVGGTAPYQLRFTTNSGYTTEVETSFYGWSGNMTYGISPDHMATLEVTDASGCTATAEAYWIPHWPVQPDLTASRICEGMLRLDWNGQFIVADLATPQPVPYSCTGPMYYTVYGHEGAQEASGQVAADWTETTPGSWRYEMPMPADPYVLLFMRNGDASCSNGMQTFCNEYLHVYISSLPAPTDCSAQLRVRAALGGVSRTGALMDDHLRTGGLLPASEPYTDLGYTYVGTPAHQSITPALLTVTGGDAIVDWVVVELRSATAPAIITHSRPALLQRDGDVVDLNGQPVHDLPFATGEYHVALRHRNHLGVMTATSRMLAPAVTTVDFTEASMATYGTGARSSVNGTMALWSGDSGGDGTIRYTGGGNDRDPILQAIGGTTPTNTLSGVYSPLDVNLDGEVKYAGPGNDRDAILLIVGGTTPTASRVQQLP